MPETLIESNSASTAAGTGPPACNSPASSATFTSSSTQLEVGDQKVILRILKMQGSTMLFISNTVEFMDELAVALPNTIKPDDTLSSTLLGEPIMTDSQRLARQLSKRFKRQFFVSCNIPLSDFNGRILEKELSNYITKHEQQFA